MYEPLVHVKWCCWISACYLLKANRFKQRKDRIEQAWMMYKMGDFFKKRRMDEAAQVDERAKRLPDRSATAHTVLGAASYRCCSALRWFLYDYVCASSTVQYAHVGFKKFIATSCASRSRWSVSARTPTVSWPPPRKTTSSLSWRAMRVYVKHSTRTAHDWVRIEAIDFAWSVHWCSVALLILLCSSRTQTWWLRRCCALWSRSTPVLAVVCSAFCFSFCASEYSV